MLYFCAASDYVITDLAKRGVKLDACPKRNRFTCNLHVIYVYAIATRFPNIARGLAYRFKVPAIRVKLTASAKRVTHATIHFKHSLCA